MKFNEKLVMLRRQHNLSQEQLAEKLKVARQTISKWELGETTPEMDKLIMISEIYNITLDQLIKEENEVKVVNDPNSTNSQKLAGMTIKIIKGIGIFILIVAILYIFFMISGIIVSNKLTVEDTSLTENQEIEFYEE